MWRPDRRSPPFKPLHNPTKSWILCTTYSQPSAPHHTIFPNQFSSLLGLLCLLLTPPSSSHQPSNTPPSQYTSMSPSGNGAPPSTLSSPDWAAQPALWPLFSRFCSSSPTPTTYYAPQRSNLHLQGRQSRSRRNPMFKKEVPFRQRNYRASTSTYPLPQMHLPYQGWR